MNILPVKEIRIRLLEIQLTLANDIMSDDADLATVHVLDCSLAIKKVDVAGRGNGSNKRGVVEQTKVGTLSAYRLTVDEWVSAGEVCCCCRVQLAI